MNPSIPALATGWTSDFRLIVLVSKLTLPRIPFMYVLDGQNQGRVASMFSIGIHWLTRANIKVVSFSGRCRVHSSRHHGLSPNRSILTNVYLFKCIC
jgi:hypothetical protein